MADPSIPGWLKSLPLAPEYRPTETEFADPIAFISRVERAAAAFGICKVVPPLPKPSRKFVLANLNRSLSKAPELGPHAPRVDPDSGSAVFTTRHQELGSLRRPNKQVWQSGEIYTLDQFESKSRSFSRSQLSGYRDVTPLLVESLFWRAVADKPISVEYANDVPGSGFAAPRGPFKNRYRFSHRRRKRKGMAAAPCRASMEVAADMESTAGWKLSNSPWNLQVIARSPGSLTRFMPDDVPGVTSPMVYIGMLYSWFAWHVEDHELHSLNFLHMGAPKTWYAVPEEYAGAVEEIVRVHGYGGNIDRLAALTMLGEKTNLLSPDVLVASGIPCCRLVQHPGEFVVTFPRAYHVGFSHGFNCGEAANFATPQWLKVAKEAAVRRAAMNYLPMLSHQQLLYLLTVSFIFRVPRELLSGVRSSRLRDRVKEERELLIKKAFLKDLMSENHLLCVLLEKESNCGAVLWDPELLPTSTNMPQSCSSSFSPEAHGSIVIEPQGKEMVQHSLNEDGYNHRSNDHMESNEVLLEQFDNDGDDLPLGLDLDSGSLACVACGILGYPFMVIVQPSERAAKELFPVNSEESHQNLRASGCSGPCMSSCPANGDKNFDTDKLQGTDVTSKEQGNPDSSCELLLKLDRHAPAIEGLSSRLGLNSLKNDVKETSCHTAFEEINQNLGIMSTSQVGSISSRATDQCTHFTDNQPPICSLLMTSVNDYGNKNTMRLMDTGESMHMTANSIIQKESSCSSFIEPVDETDKPSGAPQERSCDEISKKWNLSNGFMRPRIFCLQHALEIEEMLQSKGGARALIICYSDYLKIKPQAAAVAEEIGIQFKFKDIAINNASPAELNLINTSIDDEEYEEHGEDWTSKLGLNLKYCVKLRKQSSSNQEQPALALCGILSDLHPVSLVSCLKWHSRKTRTPKVYCSSQSKSHIAPSMKKGEPATRKANNNSAVEIQVYQRSKGKAGEVASKDRGHPKKDASKELGDSTDTLKDDHQDGHNCKTSNAASLVESSQEQQEIAAVDSTVNDSMAVQENMIAQGPILECCVDNSLSSRDQQIIQTLSVNNSELEVELQDAEELKLRDVVIDSLKSGMQIYDNTPVVDMWQDSQSLTGRKLDAQDHNNIELEGHLTSGAIFKDLGAPPNESNIEPIVDDRVETVNTVAVPVGENCGMQDAAKQTMDGNTSSSALKVAEVIIKRPIIVYTRRTERNKNKRKWEEILTNDRDYCEHFIRSPCEGLRPRSGRTSVEYKIVPRITKKPDRSVGRKGKDKGKGAHKCDIDGCHLSFRTTGDLGLHKSNRCIFKGCRKRFSSHKSAICHHLDHEDERPLKCPWNGCGMSFKWAWARTEHIRLHTGERPYQCKASGCGQTFKFMSDFSRHRRKMGHSVDSIA